MPNRLAEQTSPYLLQHQDNPVDWWAWGPEAMAKAKALDRPILLSIGYAACHWCHVMAHESFENAEVAEAMNSLFINIKLDREERPDLDAVYQHALSMMGEQGGWPLTMFLTPEGEPFWGGTYFPPSPRYGRPGFMQVLRGVSESWIKSRDKIHANADALRAGLAAEARSPGGMDMNMEMLNQWATDALRAVDTAHGGLSGAPKFPQPGLFDFLWRSYLRTANPEVRDAVILTLDHMCQGGIYDHLGGGFMRYATDEAWLVPHFEKMLYDNAQLLELLTLVWQSTRLPLYRQRVAETVEWVLREMVAEGGAFAASLDADTQAGEGRFYTWDAAEIDSLLDADSARWFKQAYDVHSGGNWEGVTILHRNRQPQPVGMEEFLADSRAVLWRRREARPAPGRDDKILADWNGMMIAALANAAFVYDMPRWLDAARTAYETVRGVMGLPDGRLAHSMRFGRVQAVGLLDDLAHMARAALALYEVTGDAATLDHARIWVQAADHHYWDEIEGGYFQSADDATDIIARTKPAHDGAVPSANGIMAQVLARLWQITGEEHYRQRADNVVSAFSAAAPRQFAHMTALLAGFEQLADPVRVEIIDGADADETQSLLHGIAQVAAPTLIVHRHHGKRAGDGHASATICRNGTCSVPISNAEILREMLASR